MVATLDIRNGRNRYITKSNSPNIIISDFAVITCCQKLTKYLKHLRYKTKDSKLSWTYDTVQCISEDKIRGRRPE